MSRDLPGLALSVKEISGVLPGLVNHPDPQDPPLAESDVRDIVRLLGQVAAAPGGIHEKRCLLMDGLCALIRATGWAWCRGDAGSGKPASIEAHSAEPPAFRRTSPPPGNSPIHILTARDRIGALVTSRRKVAEEVSGIGVYRSAGQPPFSGRETRIARIILDEVPWLHHSTFTPPAETEVDQAPLYPRHRAVLGLLCEGLSRKRIANRLQLSENTVHGYVKTIFSHFGVHSQAELINRLARGEGGDFPGNN